MDNIWTTGEISGGQQGGYQVDNRGYQVDARYTAVIRQVGDRKAVDRECNMHTTFTVNGLTTRLVMMPGDLILIVSSMQHLMYVSLSCVDESNFSSPAIEHIAFHGYS